MAKSVKDYLQDTFEDLGEGDQKKFKSKLLDRRTEPRVRRAAVDKVKDSIDLADLMVNTFTTKDAIPVTIELLKAIGCNDPAAELEENAAELDSRAPSADLRASTPAAGKSAASTEHFVDKNRQKLISRVYNVDAILDELLQMKVITDEVYETIRRGTTSQNKMRDLLMGPIKSAGIRGKDGLYKALREHEPCLVEELE